VGRFPIRDYHPEKMPLNVAEVLIVSSNKGSARIADRLGAELQQEYFKQMGFFKAAPLEIPEIGTPLIPSRWGRAEIMTVSYGHGISITPVHLTSAVATTVGSGVVISPTLIKRTAPNDFDVQLFSPDTSAQIRAMMRRVVSHPRGTANFADIDGYAVAGKTGTSEKTNGNGYNKKANITSFVSVFPAHDPKYVVFAMIDEPKPQKHSANYATAGWVAAPVGGRIIQRIAPLLGVHPVDENSPEIRRSLMLELPELNKEEEAKHASF
jgi:cell division protein FtsI (penicillin-binding protein 3)